MGKREKPSISYALLWFAHGALFLTSGGTSEGKAWPSNVHTPLPGQNPLSLPVHNLLSTVPRRKDLLQHLIDTQMLAYDHTPCLTTALPSSQHSCLLVASDLTPPGRVKSESLRLEHCKFLQALQGKQEAKRAGHMPGLQSLRVRECKWTGSVTFITWIHDSYHLQTRRSTSVPLSKLPEHGPTSHTSALSTFGSKGRTAQMLHHLTS